MITITFKSKIEAVIAQANDVLHFNEVHISDLIELKRQCDNVSEHINSFYNDVVVDINQ